MKKIFSINTILPRGSVLIFILSFFLPFISVRGCRTGQITSYSGLDVIHSDYGSLYYIAILCILILFSLTFFRRGKTPARDAFIFAWQAFLASFAGLILFLLPGIQFLFDTVLPDVGGWASIGCSLTIFVWGETNALQIIYQLHRETRACQDDNKFKGWSYRLHQALLIMSIISIPFILLYNLEDLREALPAVICLSFPLGVIELAALAGVKRGDKWIDYWNRIVIGAAFISASGFILIILTGGKTQ